MAPESKNMLESIRVAVPSRSPSSTSPNPKICCHHAATNRCSASLILANHANFTKSGAPARFMYFSSDGLWLDFEREILDSLKPAFSAGKAMLEVSFGESRYLFDFTHMLQIDFDSGNERSIAWIDVNGKCFFPKVFVREDSGDNFEEEKGEESSNKNNYRIKIDIHADGNYFNRKRVGFDYKEEPEVSSSKKEEEDQLKRQRLVSADVESSRWPNSRKLTEGETSYLLVRNHFLSVMKKFNHSVTITAVHQCTRKGHLEEARQEAFQKQIEITKATRGACNAVYAWHGASANDVESILAHGFGGTCKVSAIESYGVGVYLSPFQLPHMSAKLSVFDDNGEKHIILCRVILGNVEKVNSGSQQYYPSSINFDTGADDPKNPKWYIIWSNIMNRHIIPECVVSFKSSNHVQGMMPSLGQPGGSTCTKHSLEKLFLKMRSCLPPEKLQKVVKIYNLFKARKLAKNIFIKQLRQIAGDNILLSSIREIRSSE